MIAQRALAVAAAVLLVSAVAVATFGAESMSLAQLLLLLDARLIDRLLGWSDGVLGSHFSGSVVQPLLVRPAWLLPASAGLICTGLAFSLSNRKTTHRSHRRS